MSNDKATSPQPTAQNAPKREALLKIEDVGKEIRAYALDKTTPKDDAGQAIKDKAPILVAAKSNSSYYGKVISNTEKYLVQLTGQPQEKQWLVVHNKEQLALQGNLAKLDEGKRLNGASLQVHYKENQAKAYPWQGKEKTADKTITQDNFLSQAKQYAQENIKNANQRTAFLKHLETVADKAFPEQNKKQEKSQSQDKTNPAQPRQNNRQEKSPDKTQER